MELEGSLLRSQEPATGPCPKPGASSRQLPSVFPTNELNRAESLLRS
jgi:hypothetical protein